MDADCLEVLLTHESDRAEAADRLEEFLLARAPDAIAHRVMIALDEVLSNVFRHAGAGAVRARIRIMDRAVEVEVADDGRPYDPLAQSPPDTALDLDARQVGGLGVHLVRSLMDDVAYARVGQENLLRLRKGFG